MAAEQFWTWHDDGYETTHSPRLSSPLGSDWTTACMTPKTGEVPVRVGSGCASYLDRRNLTGLWRRALMGQSFHSCMDWPRAAPGKNLIV